VDAYQEARALAARARTNLPDELGSSRAHFDYRDRLRRRDRSYFSAFRLVHTDSTTEDSRAGVRARLRETLRVLVTKGNASNSNPKVCASVPIGSSRDGKAVNLGVGTQRQEELTLEDRRISRSPPRFSARAKTDATRRCTGNSHRPQNSHSSAGGTHPCSEVRGRPTRSGGSNRGRRAHLMYYISARDLPMPFTVRVNRQLVGVTFKPWRPVLPLR
jgi:hypothetical protein